jgi:hypothetical protein
VLKTSDGSEGWIKYKFVAVTNSEQNQLIAFHQALMIA